MAANGTSKGLSVEDPGRIPAGGLDGALVGGARAQARARSRAAARRMTSSVVSVQAQKTPSTVRPSSPKIGL